MYVSLLSLQLHNVLIHMMTVGRSAEGHLSQKMMCFRNSSTDATGLAHSHPSIKATNKPNLHSACHGTEDME